MEILIWLVLSAIVIFSGSVTGVVGIVLWLMLSFLVILAGGVIYEEMHEEKNERVTYRLWRLYKKRKQQKKDQD